MSTISIDKAGRIVLPKPVRDALQLRAGDSLELERSEDRIVLRPVRAQVGLRKKQGIWVLDIGEPVTVESVNQTLREIRHERETQLLKLTSSVGREKRKR
jgi:AbrB family looped-hinge helix DNA binding protein